MKKSPIAAVVALVALAASCGGSDADPIVSEVKVTTTVDLLDGALVPTDAGSDAASTGGGSTEPSSNETTTVPDGAATTVPGATSSTTVAGAGAATGTTQPGTGSTDGSAAGGTTSGTGGAATGGASDPLGPGAALIVISGVSYRFEAATCEFASDAIEIVGRGTASDGAEFEAIIFFENVDFDGDGTPDRVLEIFVDPAVPAGSDADTVPEFYASTLDTLGQGSSGELAFEIVGQRITGTGTIVDFNGVAFPADRPGPLTFDARCA